MKEQLTTLLVRPAARGGKYLGHDAANLNNHSALIALMEMKAGKIVAHGLAEAPTKESAGPKDLMVPVSRSAPFAADANTVKVELKVEISEPTVFRVLVFGPLSHLDQARLVQTDITLLPGVSIGNFLEYPEGLVIEVPGLCISNVMANLQGNQFNCSAKVTMMCGCPIGNKTDWSWPSTDFFVTLVTRTQSMAIYNYPLEFDSTTGPNTNSIFVGEWQNLAPNDPVIEAWIYASEPKLGNQGRYRIHPLPALPILPSEVQNILMEMRCRLP